MAELGDMVRLKDGTVAVLVERTGACWRVRWGESNRIIQGEDIEAVLPEPAFKAGQLVRCAHTWAKFREKMEFGGDVIAVCDVHNYAYPTGGGRVDMGPGMMRRPWGEFIADNLRDDMTKKGDIYHG